MFIREIYTGFNIEKKCATEVRNAFFFLMKNCQKQMLIQFKYHSSNYLLCKMLPQNKIFIIYKKNILKIWKKAKFYFRERKSFANLKNVFSKLKQKLCVCYFRFSFLNVFSLMENIKINFFLLSYILQGLFLIKRKY